MSIEKLKANYPVKIQWVHFPLHPDTPAEGRSLAEMFAGRDIEPIRQRLKSLMAEAGLAYGERTHTYNSLLAQELGAWADTQAGGDAIPDALYRAHFVDAVNISDRDALIAIAEAVGLDGDAARTVLTERSFSAKVDDDWARSRGVGVTGVPTFYANDLVVVGCPPYETIEKFVKHLLAQNNTAR